MMSSDLYQTFQRCLAQAESGVPLEECLAQHPEHAQELRPLLLAATASSDRLSGPLPPEVRSRLRQRVMHHWDRSRSPRRAWSLARVLPVRWAAVAAAAAMVFITLGGGIGTVAAAQEAAPGAYLYPVKQLREETRLWFTSSPEDKVAVYSEYARERVRELVQLTRNGHSPAAAVSLSRLEEHLNAVDRVIGEARPNSTLAQSGRSEIVATLGDALATGGPADDLQESLARNSDGAYPCLQHTIQVIREARQQVHSALANVRGNAPQGSEHSTGQVDAFCPPKPAGP